MNNSIQISFWLTVRNNIWIKLALQRYVTVVFSLICCANKGYIICTGVSSIEIDASKTFQQTKNLFIHTYISLFYFCFKGATRQMRQLNQRWKEIQLQSIYFDLLNANIYIAIFVHKSTFILCPATWNNKLVHQHNYDGYNNTSRSYTYILANPFCTGFQSWNLHNRR